jgi:hypothetical protein
VIRVRHIRKSEFALVFNFSCRTKANADFFIQLSADGNDWHTIDKIENQPAGIILERLSIIDFDKAPFKGLGNYFARVISSKGVRSGVTEITIRPYKKTVVAVIVYNRLANLERWLNCWDLCDKNNAELVVIHNQDEGIDRSKYVKACERHKVKYVPRLNKGYDIGALQDVASGKLKGFPEYDTLLWVTDDTIPVAKNFVALFLDKLSIAGVGVSCMEIGTEVTPHIRTSGFCIRKEVLSKIIFPSVIKTKEHCWEFECRGGNKTFYQQILAMNLKSEMVAELAASPLWDIDHRKNLNRWEEYERTFFKKEKKITFICPIYKSFPEIITCLLLQTHKNWELLLIHDGPADETVLKAVAALPDSRIKFIETANHAGVWGHGIRQWALQEIKEGRLSDSPDFIVITNADNYHVPVYCEYMLDGFVNNPNAVAVFCGQMGHSYINWKIIDCYFGLGGVDCAGVMVKAKEACEVGWNDIKGHSSDWTYFQDIANKYGKQNFVKVEGCLLIHN